MAAERQAGSDTATPGARQAWRRYLRRYRPYARALALIVAGALLQSALMAPAALLVRRLFNLIPGRDSSTLVLLGLGIAGLIVAAALLSLAVRRASLRVTKQVIRDLRLDLLDGAYALCRPGEHPSDRSWLHSAIVQDTERVDVMTNALLLMLPAALLGAAFAAMLLAIAPWLALALAGFAMPMLIANRTLGQAMRAGIRRFHASFAAFERGVSFTLEVLDLTRLRGARGIEAARSRESAEHLRLTSGGMALTASGYSALQTTLGALAVLASLLIGASGIASGRMSFGELAAFYFIFTQLSTVLNTLWTNLPQVLLGHQSLLNLSRILPDENPPLQGEGLRPTLQGEMRMEQVSFSYGARVILAQADWSLPAGSITALTGPSGVGKSTVAALILGLAAPAAGRVLADGLGLTRIDGDHLRHHTGFLPQEPLLFSGSIRDNVGYGFPDATAEAIQEALDWAGAGEILRRLGQSLDAQVGEGGNFLSGGERQRIAIARTLLNRPKLLVLDEPTNHLDAASVRGLLHSLKTLPQRPTIVLITHDAEVAALAGRVFELKDARLRQVTPPTTHAARS